MADIWEDVAIGPSISGSSDMWEDVPAAPSFGSELRGIANKGIEGSASLLSFLEGIMPQPQGSRYSRVIADKILGTNSAGPAIGDTLQSVAKDSGVMTEQQPQTAIGKIAGNIAKFAPSVFLPGEWAPNIVSAIGAGTAGGIADILEARPIIKGVSELVGGTAPSIFKGIGTLMGNAAENLTPTTAEDAAIRSLNVKPSQIAKAERFNPSTPLEEPNLVQSIKAAQERGIFSNGEGPSDWLSNNENVLSNLNSKANTIIKQATKSQKDVVTPTFPASEAFIKDHPAEPNLIEQFQKRQDVIATLWDGTIASLNKAKQVIQRIGYGTNSTSTEKTLDRVIAFDLRKAVENGTKETLGEDMAANLSSLNAQQSEHMAVGSILEQRKIAESAGQFKPEKAKGLLSIFSAPGLKEGTVGAGLSAITSIPYLGPLGVAYGLTKGALNTDLGRTIASETMNVGSKVANEVGGNAVNTVPQAIEDTLKNSSKKKTPQVTPMPIEAKSTKESVPSLNNTSLSAKKQGDPFELLLDSVEKVESGGNQKAVSKAGAKGPMQLMDATGKEYHDKLGIKEPYDPYDRGQARQIARAILQDNLDAFDGDIYKALTSYHSGQKNVRNNTLGPEGKKYASSVEKVFSKLSG